MRCIRKMLLFVLCFALCSVAFCLQQPAFSQDVQARKEGLTALSSSIRDGLENIRLQSSIISEELTQVRSELTVSEKERKALEEKSTALSDSLMNISGQLNSCYETMRLYEMQLKRQKKMLAALILVFTILVVLKICGYFLYWKGTKVPRWLDILI